MSSRFRPIACLLLLGCAHRPVDAASLAALRRPAVVAHVSLHWVGRADVAPVSRYQVALAVQSRVTAALPRQAPWTELLPPAQTSRAMESLLVQQLPGQAPELALLGEAGADSVLEVEVESWGVRTAGQSQGLWLLGAARLWTLPGLRLLYERRFSVDELKAGLPGLALSEVGDRLAGVAEAVARQVAADVAP